MELLPSVGAMLEQAMRRRGCATGGAQECSNLFGLLAKNPERGE